MPVRKTAKTVRLEPSGDHPLPYRPEDQKMATFLDELRTVAATAEVIEELGGVPEIDPENLKEEKRLIKEALLDRKTEHFSRLPTAMAASAFLKTYGHNLAFDVHQTRAALTNKLLEIANCGDTKFELKALELLGKHSDIGLFTNRSEISVNYRSPEALEEAIKERVKRLLNADVIDVVPLGRELDEELGAYGPLEPLVALEDDEEEAEDAYDDEDVEEYADDEDEA